VNVTSAVLDVVSVCVIRPSILPFGACDGLSVPLGSSPCVGENPPPFEFGTQLRSGSSGDLERLAVTEIVSDSIRQGVNVVLDDAAGSSAFD
jgi:hypothetical protein